MLQIVPFPTAARGLQRFTPFNPDTARGTIKRIVAISDLARAFRELKKPMPRVNIPISYKNGVDMEKIEGNILDILGKLFPIDEDVMLNNQVEDEGLFNDIGNCMIVPAFVGYETSWDEIAEAIDDGPTYSFEMSMHIFIHSYIHDFDPDHWEVFNKYFGWNVEWTEGLSSELKLKKLYKIIDERPEIKFDSDFIRANCMDTGTAFFDLNPYSADSDWYDMEMFGWSYKNIMRLTNEWKTAKAIIDRLPYNYKMTQDPDQLRLLLDAMKDAQRR